MKANIVKRMMIVVLTVSLALTPSIGVFASGEGMDNGGQDAESGSNTETTVSGGSTSSHSSSKKKQDVVFDLINRNLGADMNVEGAVSVASFAEIPTTSSVAGVKSTVAGVYLATVVNGSAVSTGADAIINGYGLSSGEKPYARFYNLEAKRSPLAYAAIVDAAASMNAVVGPTINIELGKMLAGKYSLLPADGMAIEIKLGIPKSFAQTDKSFAMICVRPGGIVTILQDKDTNPDTITFDTTGGQGAYAIIKY